MGNKGDTISRIVDVVLIVLIVASVTAIILESVRSLSIRYGEVFTWLQRLSVLLFTLEYLLRLWCCPESDHAKFHHPVTGRLNFMITPMAIVDLLAILPFYLSMFIALDLRILWIMRLLRLLKLARYSPAISILISVLKVEKTAVGAALFFLCLVLIFAATGIYFFEQAAQPDQFTSIPAALWWAVVTVTTVGYGDMTPVTPMGKMFGALVSMAGVSMIAVPAGLLSSRLTDELRRRREIYEELVEEALDDGVISPMERETMEIQRRQLELSEEEVGLIERQTQRQIQLPLSCPHCGKQIIET